MYNYLFKRIIDLLLGLIGFILALPFFITLTILLAIANNGHAYFTQERPGKDDKIFRLLKFRTMNNKCDEKGKLLSDRERLTRIGRFVRSTSLDELPQLVNVLKGDMSLIGPRPLLIKYLPLYTKTQARRHEVRPGITGWTQVNGRNSLSWEKKFELDVWYVDNLSFRLDMKILWLTIIKVFKREGINAADATTMNPFTGNNGKS
ncbi:MAG: Lipid carrier [Bacteroidetes bacterium]|nr:MAG: Lipid carrier [Bacteroidota bacterium]